MTFSMEKAVERIRRENAEYARLCEERRAQARALAAKLSQDIVGAVPGPVRVWGFGSTFSDGPYSLSSDLDLALEGPSLEPAWALVRDQDFPVDLLDITGQNNPFSQMIRSRGVVLAER